ncbi:MAG TPA: sigma-70 family RNA polymerase sigma factor [Thermoanaerobaculia bacterium]|nr:sigma-70 family RNA polymerase sigma factor [Thermoanaerobaculia bacterium]
MAVASAAVAARARADARDSAALDFETTYAAYAPLLRKIAMRKFGIPRGDAEALVHDVFTTYLANPSNVRNVRPYLIGAICNAARQHLRRDATEKQLFCEGPVCAATPDEELVESVIRSITIRSTLAQLGPSCQETLRRFYLTGESAPAIAESRQTTANYILRLLNYCRNRARAIYVAMSRGGARDVSSHQ